MAQQSFFGSITGTPRALGQFIRESRDELKKVSWPTRAQTIRYTIIVIVACIAVGMLIGGVDYLLTLLLEKII